MAVTAPVAPAGRVRSARPALTDAYAVAGASLIAAVASLTRLGDQPLSWDEAVSANAAHRTLGGLWHLLGHTDAPLSAYYVGLNAWVRLLGAAGIPVTEEWLRLPSALAAVAAVALTARLGVRLAGPAVGLAAGALLAVQPLFVFYAHDARPYTFAALLAVAATGRLLDVLDRPDRARLAGYAAVATAALYTQLMTVFVLAAHALVVLAHPDVRRRFAVAAGAAVLAAVPLVVLGHAQAAEIGWIGPTTPTRLASFAVRVAGGAVLVPLVAGLLVAQRRRLAGWVRRLVRGRAATGGVLVAAWAVLPVAGLAVASLAQPVLVPRYALAAVPGIALGAALLVRRLPRRAGAAALAGLLLASVASSGVELAQPYKYEDYRAAADAVIDASQRGDGLVFVPASFRVGVVPYLRGDGDERDPVVPADVALASPASVREGITIGGTECLADQVAGRVDGSARMFLVGASPADAARGRPGSVDLAKAAALDAGYTVVWQRAYGGVSVTLFRRR